MDPECVGSRWGSSRPGSVMKNGARLAPKETHRLRGQETSGSRALGQPLQAAAGQWGPCAHFIIDPKSPAGARTGHALEQQVPTCQSSGSFCALSWCHRQPSAWERSVSLLASSDRENKSAAALDHGPCFYSPDFTGCKNHL